MQRYNIFYIHIKKMKNIPYNIVYFSKCYINNINFKDNIMNMPVDLSKIEGKNIEDLFDIYF